MFLSSQMNTMTTKLQEQLQAKPYTTLGDTHTDVTRIKAKDATQAALEKFAQLPDKCTKLDVTKASGSARRLEAVNHKNSALARYRLLHMRQENKALEIQTRYSAGMMGEQLKREQIIASHSTEVARFGLERTATRQGHAEYFSEFHQEADNIFSLIM